MSAGSRKGRAKPKPLAAPKGRAKNCGRTGKRSWRSHETAVKAAAGLANREGEKVRTYLCEFCGMWHLTSKPAR